MCIERKQLKKPFYNKSVAKKIKMNKENDQIINKPFLVLDI